MGEDGRTQEGFWSATQDPMALGQLEEEYRRLAVRRGSHAVAVVGRAWVGQA